MAVQRRFCIVAAPATKLRLLLSEFERLKQKRGNPPTATRPLPVVRGSGSVRG